MNGLYLANVLLAILALVAMVGGWLALRQAARARQTAGLPAGRLVYADTGDWRSPDEPLFSARYGLTGKPDYVVDTPDGLIPVEVKSRTAPSQPFPSHVLQLAAYCLLTEDSEGHAPPHGLIKYADGVFAVNYTPALRRELLALLDGMRSSHRGEAQRSHNQPQRCAGCGYRPVCNQSLV
jgi:CRISPR-associated exonuclease Cas4